MQSNQFQDLIVESPASGVGLIRFNRPRVLNALRGQLMAEVVDALQMFDDDPAVGAIILTGNEKAFSAGADIGEMADATLAEMRRSDMIERWNRLQSIRKPIIAAVSGWCLGGGCELAMACDIIVASETATFGQPEINVGVIPGAGGTQRLTAVLGKSLAMEVVLNSRHISAQEALAHGLVSRVEPMDGYLDAALALAAEIAARAPLAVQAGKEAVNRAFELGLADGLAYEKQLFYGLFASEDQKEGMRAFAEKRPAQWKGK